MPKIPEKNKEYWQKRFKSIEKQNYGKGLKSLAYITLEYEKAEKELNDKINLWYERFAKNNGLTLAEAKKVLNAKELKEFKWSVDDYIKYAEENELNGQWVKELENASARVHIERFEALKLDMKAMIEKLYFVQSGALFKTLGEVYSDTYYRSCFEVQKAFGIGWNVAKVDENKLKKALSTPWTADSSTFSERLWKNREKLVSEVQSTVTRGLMTGKTPEKMINELSKAMGSSKHNAGRIIMTETAAISAMGQEEAYKELDVEEFEIVETFDGSTCAVCGELNGKHFPLSEYKIGVTVPPFHPWCRGATAPYFEDLKGLGNRFARDVKTGKAYTVPNDMTYEEWKKTQDEKYGEGTVDTVRKMNYNESTDQKQYDKYKKVLGKEAPKKFEDFQNIKYFEPEKYAGIKEHYSYKQRVPEATKKDFKAYKAIKSTGIKGTIRVPAHTAQHAYILEDKASKKDPAHIMKRMKERQITDDDVQNFVDTALFSVDQFKGTRRVFYSLDGVTVLTKSDAYKNVEWIAKTTWSKYDFDEKTEKLIREVFQK